MRAIVLLVVGAGIGLLGGKLAGAQQVARVALVTTSLQNLWGQGGDANGPSGFDLSSPLRLSLESGVIPQAGAFANCASLEDDVGNTVGGIPVQHYAGFRLAPRLVLGVFTQLGCPIDGGIGGALTYGVPIHGSMQLVFGAGVYAAPAQTSLFGGLKSSFIAGLKGYSSPVQGAARMDLVWQTKSGRALGVGIESSGTGRHGIRFGGGF